MGIDYINLLKSIEFLENKNENLRNVVQSDICNEIFDKYDRNEK
jgi:hypothetical protein